MKIQILVQDTLRQIWSTRSRFFAIFAIVALGCGFFAGLKATCPDMITTAQKYYLDYNLYDLNVKSTLGIAENDILALENMRNVEKVQPGYYADLFVVSNDSDVTGAICHAMSINLKECEDDDYINRPRLIEGRLPNTRKECLIDSYMKKKYKIGDTISFASTNEDDASDILDNSTYTIVGYVTSVQYTNFERGTTTIGDGSVDFFAYIPEDNFKYEVYTEVYVTFTDLSEYVFDSEEYSTLLDEKIDTVKDIAGLREIGRYNEIYDPAMEQINEAQALIDENTIKYNEGVAEFNTQIQEAETTLESSKQTLELMKTLYELLYNLKEASKGYEDTPLYKQIYERIKEYVDAAGKNVDELLAELDTLIKDTEKSINEGEALLRKTKKETQAQLDDAKRQLEEGQKEIDEAKAELEKIEKPSWYVFTRDNCQGYSTYGEDAERIDNISKVFPVFFILVAALVCTTTMTRMVEDERMAIGTLKALGYPRWLILAKYLFYATLATLLGSIFGLCIGFKLFPTVITEAYNIMYIYPFVEADFNVPLGLGCIFVSLISINLAVFLVCRHQMFDVPASLMRPKNPKAGKRILLERVHFIWDRISFLRKVSIRNLMRYKGRIVMTVIGVAGCTALLFTGFGLRYSISELVDLQFNEIFVYDSMVVFNPDASEEDLLALDEMIDTSGYVKEYTKLTLKNVSASVGSSNKREVYFAICQDLDEIRQFINFRDRKTGEPLYEEEDGLFINEKLAKLYDIKVGDKLRISLSDTQYQDITVTGIFENYTLNYAFISASHYEEVFGEEVKPNSFYIDMYDRSDRDKLSTQMYTNDSVLQVSFAEDSGSTFKKLVKTLDYIVLLIIAFAGALAFVVLYNLANINVTERVREIATIKVLGFYDKEVSTYINRENTISSCLGIGVGLILGIPLERFVIVTSEVDAVMFVPTVDVYSYIYAVVISFVFTLIVNRVMHNKLKSVDMVESLKSIE